MANKIIIYDETMRKTGASSNPKNRFFSTSRQELDEYKNYQGLYESDESTHQSPKTVLNEIKVKTALSKNQSPDIPFHLSLNPYQGCEHGCVYCFARPSHAYLDLSPGVDFESKINVKVNVVDCLKNEINKKNYIPQTLALGMNTDCYQPAERTYLLTRQILQTCLEYKHPVTLVTKSSLILRDLDLLAQLSELNLVHIAISVTTLDNKLKSQLEPQATSPMKRLQTIKVLADNGVFVSALVAPIIPKINDHEIESMLEQVNDNGAQSARYVFLRLPYEVKELFNEWLELYYPLKKDAVLSIIKQSHNGQLYQSKFATRMTGEGVFAAMIAKRFELALKKYNLDKPLPSLDVSLFKQIPAKVSSMQLDLF